MIFIFDFISLIQNNYHHILQKQFITYHLKNKIKPYESFYHIGCAGQEHNDKQIL